MNDNGDDSVKVANSNRVLLLLNGFEGNGDRAVEVTDSGDVIRLDSWTDLTRLLEES